MATALRRGVAVQRRTVDRCRLRRCHPWSLRQSLGGGSVPSVCLSRCVKGYLKSRQTERGSTPCLGGPANAQPRNDAFGCADQYERGMPSTCWPTYASTRLLLIGATLYSRVSRNLRSTSNSTAKP